MSDVSPDPLSGPRSRFVCLICHREIPNDETGCPYCKSRTLSPVGASPLVLGAVLATMAVLMVATAYFSQGFHAEEVRRGQTYAARAEAHAAEGDYAGSIEHYREALTYARNELGYRLNLGVALFEQGRIAEAETHFIDLLSIEPTLSIPNLQMARIMAERNAVDEATTYYRRAIYGQWPSETAARRVETRFELVSLLQREGEPLQAVAELLELLEEESDDPVVANRAAWSLLLAGAPAQALEVFETLVEEDPRNAVAHSGLAEAEFELAHFLTARTHFRQALQLNRSLTHLTPRLELCDEIVALDPSIRGLGRVSRYERSAEVLTRSATAFEACYHPVPRDEAGPSSRPSAPALGDWELARSFTGDRERPQDDETTEENLRVAQRLWRATLDRCPVAADQDQPLYHVLAKLAADEAS